MSGNHRISYLKHFKMSNERPVPLLYVNDEGKFALGEEAVEVISKIKGKIGVIAIAGLYRYLISFLIITTSELVNPTF
jgi:hypothetical protein